MALMNPGKYDFSYNQDYLMAKLYAIDVYSNFFWMVIVVVILGVATFIYYRKNAEQWSSAMEHQKNVDLNDLCREFHEMCRLMFEDENVFKRPVAMIKQMYFPRLREVVRDMGVNIKFVQRHYKHLIPDYLHYRKVLADEDVSNGIL